MSYDMIDRFLRNNLDDDDYAEYSAALDDLCVLPAQKPEGVTGAIVNARTYADRLEQYGFECEAGPLSMCTDWMELRRCLERLAEHVTPQLAECEQQKVSA